MQPRAVLCRTQFPRFLRLPLSLGRIAMLRAEPGIRASARACWSTISVRKAFLIKYLFLSRPPRIIVRPFDFISITKKGG